MMSQNPLLYKIASPYSQALFNYSLMEGSFIQITIDFQALYKIFCENEFFLEFLLNPTVSSTEKKNVLEEILEPEIHPDTYKFLMVLIKRNRINLLIIIIKHYLGLVNKYTSTKVFEISTAIPLTYFQKKMLIKKIKGLTAAKQILVTIRENSNLIGGFLIKSESNVIDFTIKNQLQQLAKHLNTTLQN